MLLLLLSQVFAHSPHDVANFVSTAPDGQVWTTDTEVLAWSVDGVQFEFFYPTFGYPVCGLAESGGLLTLGTEEAGVWVTDDNALSWQAIDGPTAVAACARRGDTLVIAGAEGVWRRQSGVWTAVPELLAVTAADTDGDVIVALADRTVWRLEGETWSPLADPPEPVLALGVDDSGAVWVGGATATYRYTDAWEPVVGAPADARTFAFDGDTVLIGTSVEGLWASEDRGATWSLTNENFEAIETGPGSPGDGVHFLDTEIADDGTYWSAQWEGIWRLPPGETVWREGALDIMPRARTVQWLGEDDLLVGVYGGGVYRGVGEDWTLWAAGVGWPYPKQVLHTDVAAFVVSGVALYISTDNGETWTTGNVGVGEIGDHVAVAPDFPDTPTIVAAGRDDQEALVVWSDDMGSTWTRSPLPGVCTDKPTVVESDGVSTWIGCGPDGEISRSTDMGKSWELAWTVGGNINDILPESPALFATDIGVVSTSDGISFETIALDGVTVDRLVRDPDGTLWAAVPGQGVGRLVADSFEPCGWPIQDRVEDLAVGTAGQLAAGTREGAWVSRDGCVSWERANNFEFLDEITQFWRFSEGWATRERTDAWAVQDIGGEAGAWAELEFLGEQVRLRGSSAAGATVRLTLDGAEQEVEVPRDSKAITMIWAADVPFGVHRVAIEVIEGTLYLDGAEVWRDDAPSLDEDTDTGTPDEQPRCGCGDKSSAGVLFGAALLGLARRRGQILTDNLSRLRGARGTLPTS